MYILWGGATHLNCTTNEDNPVIQMIGQPLAMDYNQDMIVGKWKVNNVSYDVVMYSSVCAAIKL